MPTLALAMPEEQVPPLLPAPKQPKQSSSTTAEPKKRGRKRLLHDEEQRRARRKVQCKLNQRRYRARQRDLISTLTLETEGLSGHLQDLRDYHSFLGNYCQEQPVHCDNRPRFVVDAFFTVFKTGFALQSTETSELQESFVRLVCAPEMVSQGATSGGVDALLLQCKRYASYHGTLEMRQRKVQLLHAPTRLDGEIREDRVNWIVEAQGSLSLRISRDTLLLVYPHLLRHHDALVQRIVGQTIEPDLTAVFQFDARAKVTKLEYVVDFAGAFFRLLKSAEDVATVLDGALISPLGELGLDPQDSRAESALTRGSKQLSLKFILL